MTDIKVTKEQYRTDDRDWLLFEAQGVLGPVSRGAGTLDLSKFTRNTHYPDGYLPTGLVLVGELNELGPYSGTGTPVGLLYNTVSMSGDLTRKVGTAFVDSFATVSVKRLPAGSGFAAAVRAALPLVKFRA